MLDHTYAIDQSVIMRTGRPITIARGTHVSNSVWNGHTEEAQCVCTALCKTVLEPCWIWGSHTCDCGELCSSSPTFRRNLLPPPPGSKSKLSKQQTRSSGPSTPSARDPIWDLMTREEIWAEVSKYFVFYSAVHSKINQRGLIFVLDSGN